MNIYTAQLRGHCSTNNTAVDGYIRDLRDGVPIEPITVEPGDQPDTWQIVDGRNRALAFFLENINVVEVVRAGQQ